MSSQTPEGDVLGGAEGELEEFQIGSCAATPAEFVDSDDGGVEIQIRPDEIETAIEAREGLVLVTGKSKKKRVRAASVLLNDVAVNHPDGLYFATHGSAVRTSIRSVMVLDRRGFEHDEDFMEKLLGLDPDAITLEINNENDLGLAFRLVHDIKCLVLGITETKSDTDLQTLTDTYPLSFITVVAK